MTAKKNNPFTLLSEFIFYIIGILSIINPILISNNSGNVIRMPAGLLLSDLSAILSYNLVNDGMLETMTWYWAIIIVFGIVPALIMITLGYLIRRQKKQALIVGIALMIADSFILFSFLNDPGFLILNAIIRIIVLVLLILGAKNMKANQK